VGKFVSPAFVVRHKEASGYGVYAKKDCKKGDVFFVSRFKLIDDDGTCFSYENEDGIILKETPEVHYTPVPHLNKLVCYPDGDAFMNHSCNPNIMPKDTDPLDVENPIGHFDNIALKDIKAGDELTCDYNNYEWDFDGFTCTCGAKNCCGEARGFKYLPEEVQKQKLPFTNDNVKFNFAREKKSA